MIIKIGLLILAYLIGSIPWGFVFGKLKGIDIREHGSKNIGATNTGRLLGKKYAVLAYILDMLKGFILVFLFRFEIIPNEYMFLDPTIYGLIAVIGHTFPIYLGFKGGKAVATGGGVIFGYCPYIMVGALSIFFLVTYISKYVSLGSLIATFSVFVYSLIMYLIGHDPIFVNLPEPSFLFPLAALIITCIIFIKHIPNIKRIINKTESKVKWGTKQK